MGVSNQPPDFEHLEPVLERNATYACALPVVMMLDAGYWSENNINVCADQGIDAYNRYAEAKGYATGWLPHGQKLPPKCGPLPRDANIKTRMTRKLRCKKGSSNCVQRKGIMETVNSQIKEGRGLRGFLVPGLETANG
jgi:hypothetical protein